MVNSMSASIDSANQKSTINNKDYNHTQPNLTKNTHIFTNINDMHRT